VQVVVGYADHDRTDAGEGGLDRWQEMCLDQNPDFRLALAAAERPADADAQTLRPVDCRPRGGIVVAK
jgi:hypothetical protein